MEENGALKLYDFQKNWSISDTCCCIRKKLAPINSVLNSMQSFKSSTEAHEDNTPEHST